MGMYLDAQALAALGFAVLIVDGRGTALRDKAFHDHSYGAIHLASDIDDHIAAITQLAQTHDFIDTDRVGIFGFSGGGYATVGAMLRRPDVFSVGVAGGGNYDQRLFWASWGERFHGLADAIDYDAQHHLGHVDGLRGKLMLVHGLQDGGCHPAALMQLAQALMDANKDFDLLLQPRVAHAMNGYLTRRIWDHFVTHLQRRTPPTGIQITTGTDLFLDQLAATQAAIEELIAAGAAGANAGGPC